MSGMVLGEWAEAVPRPAQLGAPGHERAMCCCASAPLWGPIAPPCCAPSGHLPDWRTPMVLLSTRLTEVRAFSDFFAEFQQSLASSSLLPRNTRMVVLCSRPSFEVGKGEGAW